jgi:hypothetical protein
MIKCSFNSDSQGIRQFRTLMQFLSKDLGEEPTIVECLQKYAKGSLDEDAMKHIGCKTGIYWLQQSIALENALWSWTFWADGDVLYMQGARLHYDAAHRVVGFLGSLIAMNACATLDDVHFKYQTQYGDFAEFGSCTDVEYKGPDLAVNALARQLMAMARKTEQTDWYDRYFQEKYGKKPVPLRPF